MPYRNRVEIAFEAGHRLLEYPGKCAAPHGHSYRAELLLEGDGLDDLGLLLDFDAVKSKVRGWIMEQWDHGFLVNRADTELVRFLGSLAGAKLYCLDGNPSAELLARELFQVAGPMLDGKLVRVRIWESDRQYGEYSPGP